MEHGPWTNERLDDLATSMREGFARVDGDIRDLRGEMNDGFSQLRGEIAGLRGELRSEIGGLRGEIGGEIGGLRGEIGGEIGRLRGEINALRQMMFRAGGAMIATMCIGFLSVLAAILARGA